LRHGLNVFMQEEFPNALRDAFMDCGTELRSGIQEDIRNLLVVHPSVQCPVIPDNSLLSSAVASMTLGRKVTVNDMPSQQLSRRNRRFLTRRMMVDNDDMYNSEQDSVADHHFSRRPIRPHPETLGRR